MSVQRFMHPKNIYRTPPNFKQLAIEYPEFRKFVVQDVSGKISIDFKDPQALRALTCTLLEKDFGLNVRIPLDKMIPTVPLRLNYILFIEDLLNISGKNETVRGIDIGTGASCIYCLIAAKSKGWHMIGTDINNDSIENAQYNISKNNLQNLITVKRVKGDRMLKEVIEDAGDVTFDFCMCNPPFFSNTLELNPFSKARRPDRPRPKNAFCATTNEVVHIGGEVEFVKTMIKESIELKTRIRIYTTMLGHKSSLPELKAELRHAQVKSFKETEFCQGNTTRWGLAWTYCDLDLRKIPQDTVSISKKQKCKPVQYKLESSEVTFEEFIEKLTNIFKNLQMTVEKVSSSKKKFAFCFTAFANTWSHQRRKRREQEHLNKILCSPEKDKEKCMQSNSPNSLDDRDQCDIQNTTNLIGNMKFSSPKSNTKRECEDNIDYCDHKKTKTDGNDKEKNVLVNGVVSIIKDGSNLVLEMVYIDGTAGKEGVHQILQYVKNNWKNDS